MLDRTERKDKIEAILILIAELKGRLGRIAVDISNVEGAVSDLEQYLDVLNAGNRFDAEEVMQDFYNQIFTVELQAVVDGIVRFLGELTMDKLELPKPYAEDLVEKYAEMHTVSELLNQASQSYSCLNTLIEGIEEAEDLLNAML